MSELGDKLRAEVQRIIDEPMPEPSGKIDAEFEPSKPEIETEGVFNQDYLEESGAFIDNPMAAMLQPLIRYFESIKPKYLEPVKSEHKVRIFQFNAGTINLALQMCAEIEQMLNDGWCCHFPIIVNDFLIMDFSRRKENEKDETGRDGRKD